VEKNMRVEYSDRILSCNSVLHPLDLGGDALETRYLRIPFVIHHLDQPDAFERVNRPEPLRSELVERHIHEAAAQETLDLRHGLHVRVRKRGILANDLGCPMERLCRFMQGG
jgi:hypothetical protein